MGRSTAIRQAKRSLCRSKKSLTLEVYDDAAGGSMAGGSTAGGSTAGGEAGIGEVDIGETFAIMSDVGQTKL